MSIFRFNGKTRVVYNLLTVIIWIFWGLFIVSAIFIHAQKKYIYPVKYSEYVVKYASEYNLNKFTVYAFINVESSFNEDAISPKGAIGLMQILPSTANFIADKLNVTTYDLSDPETNVAFGCYYLRYLTNKFKDSRLVICAYNAGETRVREWLKDNRYSKDGITLNVIPYKETKNYVDKIEKTFEKYVNLHGKSVDNLKKFE